MKLCLVLFVNLIVENVFVELSVSLVGSLGKSISKKIQGFCLSGLSDWLNFLQIYLLAFIDSLIIDSALGAFEYLINLDLA